MNYSVVALAFILISSTLFLGCPIQGDLRCIPADIAEIPAEIEIRERAFSVIDEFEVVSGGKRIGTVKKKVLNWGTTYTMGDTNDHYIAKARARIFSWGTKIDVTDCAGNHIGTINEEIIESAFTPFGTTYTILNAKGNEIATSKKRQILKTKFTLTDAHGKPIAIITRPAINLLSDKWALSIQDFDVVDPRLLIMIPVFKTDSDNRKAAVEEEKESN